MRGKFNLFFHKFPGALSGEETLIEKTYQEPYRGIVQADDALALQGAFAVIPGAHAAALQEQAAYIFAAENTGHIYKTPPEDRFAFHMVHDRRQECGAAVDGEHPQRRVPGQFWIAYAQGVQAGPEDFHGPSDDAAAQKILCNHKDSMGNPENNYALEMPYKIWYNILTIQFVKGYTVYIEVRMINKGCMYDSDKFFQCKK